MKKIKTILLLSILLIPTLVFASSGDEESFPIFVAIFMELFISLHMSAFVLKPLSEMISPSNSKSLFLKMFAVRAVVLLIFDFFITPSIAVIDFISVFVGAFIIVPIAGVIYRANNSSTLVTIPSVQSRMEMISNNNFSIKMCVRCGTMLTASDKFCPNCGTATARVGENANTSKTCNQCGAPVSTTSKFCGNCGSYIPLESLIIQRKIVTPNDFEPIYNATEEFIVENFISKEMEKAQITITKGIVPRDVLKRKKILNIIFSLLLFVLVSLIFFHCSLSIYIIGIILLIIFYVLSRRFDLKKYLKKEVKARPSEKISNIVMSTKNSLVHDTSNKVLYCGAIIAIALPLLFFMNPRVFYEKTEEGYWVRFYAFGLTNYKTVEIPSTHNGEPVIGLRGNTFSNMYFLEEAILPDSILYINGQAFKNDSKLVNVKLPSNLRYLGGGSFYNCKSLVSIEIPDTVTEMGGETFYNATSLRSVKLSNNLKEIRGNTFENCTSLTSIEIPDTVTRIGGHAFYGCTSLQTVTVSPLSRLGEIGSSAFRRCYNLKEIMLPFNTIINQRAFKESPTVIKKYNVANVSIDSTKYPKSKELYLSSSKSVIPIDIYNNGTFVETAKIYFLGANPVNGLYQYNFKFESKNGNVNFVLDQDNPSKQISPSLIFALPNDYDLTKFNQTVKVIGYYN